VQWTISHDFFGFPADYHRTLLKKRLIAAMRVSQPEV